MQKFYWTWLLISLLLTTTRAQTQHGASGLFYTPSAYTILPGVFDFGLAVNKAYTSDVIISPEGITSWWRKKGHEICSEDLEALISNRPETVVIGTGTSGAVRIRPEVWEQVEAKGITLVTETTDRACETYNRLCGSGNIVAALHLTC